MKAILVHDGGALSYEDYPDPAAGPGEVVVELRAAGLNRRDLLLRNPPGPAYQFDWPVVPGSDGAGIRRDTGEEVVIYPGLHWGEREDAAGPDWEILGGPSDGTYAELVKVPEENVFPKPARFSWEEAAAFPLAALTAYRGLFEVGRLTGGESVLVLGAGSGVSTLAVSLAAQVGAPSSSPPRRRRRSTGRRSSGRRAASCTRRKAGRRPPGPSTSSSTRSARPGASR